jgi:hypothetical protein
LFAGLALSAKLVLIGLGVWVGSHTFLDGCERAVGKFVGSVIPGFTGIRAIKEIAGFLAIVGMVGVEAFKSIIDGC